MDLSRWVLNRRWDDWLDDQEHLGTRDKDGNGETGYAKLRKELGLTGEPVRRPVNPYPFE